MNSSKEMIYFVVIAIIVVLGLRLLWAKFIYNDMRCIFAECRIIK